jgi:choline dehydrogenase-like flavoprotein
VFADARSVPRDGTLPADLCIVGAGAAGITLARAFVGRPERVLVLESGGMTFESETQALYEGAVTGVPYFPLDAPRLRYFGGTTNHWAGVCRPFDEADYEARGWIRHSGWPLTKSEVDPYYARAEGIVHLNGDHWDTKGWVDRDPLHPLPFGRGRVETRVDQIVPEEFRPFGRDYGNQLKAAGNVTVYLHANVTELLPDDAGTSIAEVRVATLDGNRFSIRPRSVAVAVGGIENPRLLLASRSRFPSGIGNANDLVGRYFLEHPRFIGGVIAPATPNLSLGFYVEHRIGTTILQPRLGITRATQEAEGMADVQFNIDPVYEPSFEDTKTSPDVAALKALRHAIARRGLGDVAHDLSAVLSDLMSWDRFFVPGAPLPVPYPEVVGELMRVTPPDRQALIPALLGDVAGFLYTRVGDVPVNAVTVTTRFEPVPNPDSRVTLTAERDSLGMPRPKLDWELTETDRRTVRRALEILGAELGRAGIGRLRILFDEHAPEWPSDLAGGYHLIGTTRMSDDPRRGVVDRNGRVHGMSNLYLAGSSVFPTAGSGNPTMLIVALTLRLADHLKATAA